MATLLKPFPVMIATDPSGADVGLIPVSVGPGCETETAAAPSTVAPLSSVTASIREFPVPVGVAVKLVVVLPAGIVTDTGTEATPGLTLNRLITSPRVGAGWVSVILIVVAFDPAVRSSASGHMTSPG